MYDFTVNKEKFKFKYLPEYANFLLKNKLDEFVLVGIRFGREENLPLLKPLSNYSEHELTTLGMESNREMLEALAANTIAEHIAGRAERWSTNTIGILKSAITAEDITLVFFLRRKRFAYFLDSYTKNMVEQKFIIAELDVYTTQEQLFAYKIYLEMQQEKINAINADSNFYKSLLLKSEELGGTGSFSINFKDPSKSIYTPQYKKIFEMDGHTNFNEFIKCVHPKDRKVLLSKIDGAYKRGGTFEVEYRYKKSKQKRIWSKGFIIAEDSKPVFIRGIVKELNPKRRMGAPV